MSVLRSLAVLFFFLLVSYAPAQNFAGPTQISLSQPPNTMVVGDFNGDGLPDIEWASYIGYSTHATLHILLAQPGGGYKAAPDLNPFPVSTDPLCQVADINSDHKLDLVCVGAIGTPFTTYLGNGDGTFTGPFTPVYNAGSGIISAPLDLNGDGIPDFVITTYSQMGNPYAEVYLGDGKGSFQLSQYQGPYAPQNGPVFPTTLDRAVDLNGDGIPDLLFASGPTVALGLGNGKFAPLKNFGNAPTCRYFDMDKDGHLDAVCSADQGTRFDPTKVSALTIQHGNPDGSFNSTPFVTQIYDGAIPSSIYPNLQSFSSIQDLNGDGYPDLLFLPSGDGLGVMLGGPGPSFQSPSFYAIGYPNCGYIGYAVLTADMNADGHPDIVSCGYQSLLIANGQPDGSFRTAHDEVVARLIHGVTVADFNNDGNPDVITSGEPALRIAFGKGNATFTAPAIVAGSSPVYTSLFHGDFNGDGNQDLFAIDAATNGGQILLGKGDGTFASPIPTHLTPPTLIADLNGDGRDDLLYSNFSISSSSFVNGVTSLISQGDGTFTQFTVPLGVHTGALDFIAVADFDGDGKPDLAAVSETQMQIFHGNGDGSFATPGRSIALNLPAGAAINILSLTAADFDGDGHKDLAVRVRISPTVFTPRDELLLFYGNGDGTFSAPTTATVPFGGSIYIFPQQVEGDVAADLRKEGRPELVYSSYVGAFIVHTTPQRTIDPPQYIPSNLSSFTLALDLNRDGFLDLLTVGYGTTVTPILNLTSNHYVSGTLTASPEPSPVGQAFTATATLAALPNPAPLAGNITFAVDGATVGSAPLNANAASFLIPGTLPVGAHTLTADWPGDSTYAAVQLTHPHLVTGLASLTTITSSANPSFAGSSVTFTAVVTATNGSAPTGTVVFTDSGTPLQTVTLTPITGNASSARFTTATLSIGSHPIAAFYSGDAEFSSSTASLNQLVRGLPGTASLSASPNPARIGQSVVLNFSLAGLQSGLAPSGSVTFTDGSTHLGTIPPSPAGQAFLTASFATVGTHALTASFSGDAHYLAASANADETIEKLDTTLSLTSHPNPSFALQPITFNLQLSAPGFSSPFTGTVDLSDGTTVIASPPLTSNGNASFTTSLLQVGTHSITAFFSASSTLLASNSSPILQVVNEAASITTLTATPNPSYEGQPITLLAGIVTSTGSTPTGSIIFQDSATVLGTALLNQDKATLVTSSLTPGTHSLTAHYSGDSNTAPSLSATFTQTVLPSDFILTSTPTALSLATGHHLTFTVTATSVGVFSGPMQLSNGTLPAHVTLRFTPGLGTITPGGQFTTSIYLDTDDVIGYLSQTRTPARTQTTVWSPTLGACLLPFLTFLLVPRKRRSGLALFTAFAALFLLLNATTGCSGKYPASTEPGNYIIPITFTGTITGTAHTLSIPLVVIR